MARINFLHLDEKLRAEVEKVWPLSCKRILEMDEVEIRKLGNFSDSDIHKLKDAAVSVLLGPSCLKTVAEMEEDFKQRWRLITTECKELDSILGGGLPTIGLTELSGESGVGKTQLCLQLSITVQYPTHLGGLDAGVVYICTEDRFPSNRLHQMAEHFPRSERAKRELSDRNFENRIYIDHIADVESLKDCLTLRVPNFVKMCKVGLIVIDSIAAVFRTECDSLQQSASRAKDIRNIGIRLHKLARRYNLSVVCVNQVADTPQGRTVPTLGLAWANLVTTKLQVVARSPQQTRELRLLTAPHLPPDAVPFLITEAGVVTSV